MKKKVLASIMALSTLTGLGISHLAHANNFSSGQIANVKVRDLDFKNITRSMYAGKLRLVMFDNEELQDLPTFSISDPLHGNLLGAMHPIISYTNHQGETRYLVIVEKIQLNEENEISSSCHACKPYVDLFTFKRVMDGYQLVSKSLKDDEIPGSWGRMGLNPEDLESNFRLLGRDLTGSVFFDGYSSNGVSSTSAYAILLPENNFIRVAYISDIEGDNSGMVGDNSPLSSSYEGTMEVINNGGHYYPIRLHFTGDMPIDEDLTNVQYVDYYEILNYNSTKNAYE